MDMTKTPQIAAIPGMTPLGFREPVAPFYKRFVRFLLSEPRRFLWVNDGGDWPVKDSRDEAAIIAAIESVEDCVVVVRDADGLKLGAFWLILSNEGAEQLCDYSDNVFCNAVADALGE